LRDSLTKVNSSPPGCARRRRGRARCAAILALTALSACSPGQQPTIIAEAHAAAPSNYDYGGRTAQSNNAVADGTVFEYQ
jgi:hypothetical protein